CVAWPNTMRSPGTPRRPAAAAPPTNRTKAAAARRTRRPVLRRRRRGTTSAVPILARTAFERSTGGTWTRRPTAPSAVPSSSSVIPSRRSAISRPQLLAQPREGSRRPRLHRSRPHAERLRRLVFGQAHEEPVAEDHPIVVSQSAHRLHQCCPLLRTHHRVLGRWGR